MGKRDLWKVHKRLDTIEAELLSVKSHLNQLYTKEEQTILMYEASIGKTGTALDTLAENELKIYALRCREYLKFGREVDLCLANQLNWHTAIRVGTTPAILKQVGCDIKDMYITQKHVKHILHEKTKAFSHYHDIDIRQLKQLPELMEKPLAIISGDNDTIVMVLDASDKNENQLIVPIYKNGQAFYQENQVEANCVLSAYGKENIAKYLERSVSEDRLLFFDNEISTKIRQLPLQLRQTLSNDAYENSIPQTIQKVNESQEKNPENQGNKALSKIEKEMKI